MKPQPSEGKEPVGWCIDSTRGWEIGCVGFGRGSAIEFIRPRYKEGDILYVRETWCQIKDIPLWQQYHRGKNRITKITPEEYVYKADNIPTKGIIIPKIKWHPSIHMPKEAARIFLRINRVRVERLQDITDEEARKEGCGTGSGIDPNDYASDTWYELMGLSDNYDVASFAGLWNSTIKKENLDKYGWEANPWVWVYEFERLEVEE